MKGFRPNGYTLGILIPFIVTLQFLDVSCRDISPKQLGSKRNTSSSTAYEFKLEDGEQIALEVSNQLLPPVQLSNKISQELKLIKYKYRVVSKINHQRKWIPGQLISTRITQLQILQLNESSYGPLSDITTIDLNPFYVVTILSFNKPYNPVLLSQKLSFEYGFSSSPNTVYFDGDDIFYDVSNSTYIFKRGVSNDCVSGPLGGQKANGDEAVRGAPIEGCSTDKKHFWEFIVSDTGNVRLVNEYDIDVEGRKLVNRRYHHILKKLIKLIN